MEGTAVAGRLPSFRYPEFSSRLTHETVSFPKTHFFLAGFFAGAFFFVAVAMIGLL
jgi:hypothetical protein